ncbi:MAG: PLAT/LH2 domain-containing protein [Actinomycetota bacterium]
MAYKDRPVKIQIGTADTRGAGTDSDITIVLRGSEGDAGPYLLDKPGNDFERGDRDEYQVDNGGAGYIRQIVLESDGSGLGADWEPDWIDVSSSVYWTTVAGVHGGENRRNVILGRKSGLKAYISARGVEPRMGDVRPDNAVQILERDLGLTFAWVSCRSGLTDVVRDQIVEAGRHRGGSFADNFVDVRVSSGELYRRLEDLEDSDDPAETAVAEILADWIRMRERTLAMFDRLDEYLEQLNAAWQKEQHELELAFTRPFDVEVEYVPAETSETVEGIEAMEFVFSVLEFVPVPQVEAAVQGAEFISGLVKGYVEAGLRGPSVNSRVTGGRADIVDVVGDELYRLHVDTDMVNKTLRKTALRSLSMLEECSETEYQITDEARTLGAGGEARVAAKYFPTADSLRGSLRPYWRRVLQSEAVLVGEDHGRGRPASDTDTWDWIATSGSDGERIRSRSWRLMLRGEDRDDPAEGATPFSPRALERFHWLFSSRELVEMMIDAGRAYPWIVVEEFGGSSFGAGSDREEGWGRLARDGSGYGGRELYLDVQQYWTLYERQMLRADNGEFTKGSSRDLILDFDVLDIDY